MRRLALGFLLCSLWSAASVVAQSPLCEPRFWGSATQRSRMSCCSAATFPLPVARTVPKATPPHHLAAVFANDAGAVRALVAASGDVMLRNAAGAMPLELSMQRYETHVVGGGGEDPTLAALETLFLSRADPATRREWRAALDRAIAAKPSRASANPSGGGGGGPGADPFAALDQAFAAEVSAEVREREEAVARSADAEPADSPVDDPFAALDRAFAAEAAVATHPANLAGWVR